MAKREFLMLAHPYKGESVGNWYWSEKLDGCRAFWDGGITRGQLAAEVPFANTAKDYRYITAPRATGLWSRYGKPIQAPGWWLDKMPPFSLDGELYMGPGRFQELMSTIRTLVPGPGWDSVAYKAFDTPPYHVVFANGEIDNVNFRKVLTDVQSKLKLDRDAKRYRPASWEFRIVYEWLRKQGDKNEVFQVHEQHELPSSSRHAGEDIQEILGRLLSMGCEGLMLRNPVSFWAPQRARTLLKVKGMLDAEAEVVGYTWGRETDRGSKLLGRMGALVVRLRGRQFELSGFTEEERRMCFYEGADHAHERAFAVGCQNPGLPVSREIHNPLFPIGSTVTFKYREMTDAGIPKEARYWRRPE